MRLLLFLCLFALLGFLGQIGVSTQAVHGKEVSTGGLVIPRGCEGKTFCNIKPANFPQKEIDRFLKSNPGLVKRMKREADLSGWSDGCKEMEELMPALEDASDSGNCKTKITCEQPYALKKETHVPQVIVQSMFFNQTVRQVRCSAEGNTCFRDFARSKFNTKCEEITVITKVFVYNPVTNNVTEILAQNYVDCACVIVK